MKSRQGIFSYVALFMLLFTVSACNAQAQKAEGEAKTVEAKVGGVIHLTTAEFKAKVFDYTTSKEWSYKGDVPAILDFHAVWCGPCKMLAPHLEAIKKEYGDKLQIYKIDVDKEKEVAAAFGIQAMPTLVFIPLTGQPTGVQGYQDKEALSKLVKEVLKLDVPQ